MKRDKKKLMLSRETVRTLQDSDLRRVIGGGPWNPGDPLPPDAVSAVCGPTMSCVEQAYVAGLGGVIQPHVGG